MNNRLDGLGIEIFPLAVYPPHHQIGVITFRTKSIGDKDQAIINAYGYLYKPGILGTICDGLGVLTIAVASIPLMRNLAIYGSFWVLSIYVSSIVLHPVLVSLMPPPRAKPPLEQGRAPTFSRVG